MSAENYVSKAENDLYAVVSSIDEILPTVRSIPPAQTDIKSKWK